MSIMQSIPVVTACQSAGSAILGALRGLGCKTSQFLISVGGGGVSGGCTFLDRETGRRFRVTVTALDDLEAVGDVVIQMPAPRMPPNPHAPMPPSAA